MRCSRTWRFPAVLCIAVALAAPAYAQQYAPPAPAAPPVIVPGYAVGPWTLDMSVPDLVFWLGPAPHPDPSAGPFARRGELLRTWSAAGVLAFNVPWQIKVDALGITSIGYQTREHVGVGAREPQVTAAYGQPTATLQLPERPKLLVYNALGLAFLIAYDPAAKAYTTVAGIYVFRPGRADDVWQAP